MKWKLNSLSIEPKLVMYYFVKLLGLAPFTLKGNRFYPPTLLYAVYAMLVAIMWIYGCAKLVVWLLGVTFQERVDSPESNNLIIIFLTPIHLASLLATFLLPWLMYRNVLYISNNLCAIVGEFKSLGIAEDLNKYFKELLVKTVIVNVGLGAAAIAYCSMQFNLPVTFAIQYVCEAWLQFNAILIFCHMLLFMKQRFKLVNKILYNEFKPAISIQCPSQSPTIGVCQNSRGRNQEGIVNFTKLRCLRKIEELHLELTEMVDQVNDLFAIQNILKILQITQELMTYCFWIYRDNRQPDLLYGDTNELLYITVNNLGRAIIGTVQLFCIAYASAETCREGNATRTVLFEVWYESKPRELVDEFYMFALQMLHKPVAVSAFGFFDLGYSLLSRTFSTVVAYVIVMIQFHKSQPTPGT